MLNSSLLVENMNSRNGGVINLFLKRIYCFAGKSPRNLNKKSRTCFQHSAWSYYAVYIFTSALRKKCHMYTSI